MEANTVEAKQDGVTTERHLAPGTLLPLKEETPPPTAPQGTTIPNWQCATPPPEQPQNTRASCKQTQRRDKTFRPPAWLKLLCGLGLLLMANQISFFKPTDNHAALALLAKISLSEIAFAISFLAAAVTCVRYRLSVQIPLLCLLTILAMSAANVFARTGMQGMVETAQMAMILVGGVSLFAFMLRYMPATTLVAVTAGMLLNLAVGIYQWRLYGSFLTLAPKDVMELRLGFGQAVTGLFRSRIAFGIYLSMTLAWTLPQWLNVSCKSFLTKNLRDLFSLVLTVVTLLFISHGLLALITLVAIIIAGFSSTCNANSHVPVIAAIILGVFIYHCPQNLQVQTWKNSISVLKGYDYVPDAKVLFNQPRPVQADEPSESAHELKTAHYDFIAALRLAQDNPWHGVGSGNYQAKIGKAYFLNEDLRRGQLPHPSLNDLETDAQAAWGILLATLGIPATLTFALLLLATLGSNARRLLEDMEDSLALHLGAATALLIVIIAMFFTDPTIRGIGWFLALAIASAETGPQTRKYGFVHPLNNFTPKNLFLAFVLVGLMLAIIPMGPAICTKIFPNAPLADTPKDVRLGPQGYMYIEPPHHSTKATQLEQKKSEDQKQPLNAKDNTQSALPHTPDKETTKPPQKQEVNSDRTSTTVPPECIKVADNEEELLVVFNANHATTVTPPMQRQNDLNEDFEDGILVIPDKAGVPPPGKKPQLKYGGAVFHLELKHQTTAYLWLNVMWDGSCGNTLDVRVDDAKKSYTVGNDGTYNAWHWQRSPKSYKLAPGRHTIEVLNREDGVKLAQLMLTDQKDYIPEGVESE